MANPSGRSFRVIDRTHLAAVAVLQAQIGAGNELLERPEMAAFINLNFTSIRLIGCVHYSAASLASAIASISIIASGV